ncbi:DMT family transporter [Mammaliicoccus sciuri]|uniref:DMT family transporter n=1 Tax=Mammaliicoccus sciuri TaxID=1296 RepID=UPI000878FD56|nr:SMR family transporter [Mammaliicoccus sciuri]
MTGPTKYTKIVHTEDLLVISLKGIPLSIAYSVWSGLGTVGTAIVGIFLFNEVLTLINISGLAIIIVGVVIMNMSKKEESGADGVV